MRSAVACGVLAVLFGTQVTAGAGPVPAPDDPAAATAEDAKLSVFFRAYLDDWFRDEPLAATRLGDHRYDDRLDDLSPDARARRNRRDREALARVRKGVRNLFEVS